MKLFWKKKIKDLERIGNERYWPLKGTVDALVLRVNQLEAERDYPAETAIIKRSAGLKYWAHHDWPTAINAVQDVMSCEENEL